MYRLLKQMIVFIFSLLGVMLLFRFILKFLGANEASMFVSFVYDNTQPLLTPFTEAFPTPSIRGRFVIEFTTLFAIFVYGFMSYIFEEFLELLQRGKTKK